jgi:hypothetical protein
MNCVVGHGMDGVMGHGMDGMMGNGMDGVMGHGMDGMMGHGMDGMMGHGMDGVMDGMSEMRGVRCVGGKHDTSVADMSVAAHIRGGGSSSQTEQGGNDESLK